MKVRKIIILTMVLTLIFGTAVFAESITQKLRIVIDKKEYDDAGILVDNKAYVAVGTLAQSLQALVSWDNEAKKVTIYKPNVHMFLMMDSAAFGVVDKNSRIKFRVFSQIDNLKTNITAFKVTISDPYDNVTLIEGRDDKDKDWKEFYYPGKDNFWFTTDGFSYQFDYAGKYTIQFWMKIDDNSPMQVVSEKVITSK
jgi:hypothetical protein